MEQSIRNKQAAALAETGGYYKHICWMALPLVCMSAYLYGPRPILLCLAALLTGNLCDRLVALLRRRVYRSGDWSNESFALVIALLMPATVSWYVLVVAVLAGVLLGKEAFGGYGSYPFHPAAVGYVVVAVSWPEQVFLYPQPYAQIPLWDPSGVTLVNGMSSTLRNGGLPTVNSWSLVLGEFAAPLGSGAVLILLACALFLFTQKDLRPIAAVSFLAACAAIVFLFPRQADLVAVSFLAACAAIVFLFPRQADLVHTGLFETAAQRLNLVKYELVSGATLYSAVFLVSEPYTCPKRRLGQLLYGALLGGVSVSFRYFGVYETGVCFAILIMNSLSGWLDRVVDRLYSLPGKAGGKEAA